MEACGYSMETQQLNIEKKCTLFVKLISAILICTSLAVIIGWLFHITLFTNGLPEWTSIKSITAICFILSACVLLAKNYSGYKADMIANLFSWLILLIGCMTLVEYLFDIHLGIDQLIIKDTLSLPSHSPGRMTFITALNFIFVALAFLFKKYLSGWLSQIFCLLVFLMGLFSFYNYIFSADMRYAFAVYTTMAFITTLLFMLLSIGMFFIKPYNGITKIALGDNSSRYYLSCLLPIFLFVPMIIALLENELEHHGLIEGNLGDSILASGTFVIVSIVVSIVVRKIDADERKFKSAQIQLKQNEMVFHQFADNIDIVFYRTSIDRSKILYISKAYEKIWGKSIESLYKNPMEWFDSILPEDRQIVKEEFFAKLNQGNTSASVEFRLKKPDGSIRNIFSKASPLKDHDNKPFCITGIAVDMTDIKQEKKYLHNREDILNIIESEASFEEMAHKILKLICQMLSWDLGEVWLIDETKNTLRFTDNWHIDNEKINQYSKISGAHTFKLGEGFPGRIWQEKGPVWIPNYPERREFSRSLDAEKAGLNCAFGMPIIFQDQVFGILEFFSYKMQTPDEAMLSQMTNIGRLMGEFIHRTKSNDQIQSLSRRDILTGFLNRSALEDDLNNLINDVTLEVIAIIIVDIDKFNMINKALGHDQGDLLIQSAAKRLETLIDKDKNHAARIGADKFILYYFNIKNVDDVAEYVHQVEKSFKKPFYLKEREIYLTVSLGITIYPEDGIDSKTLIKNADQALSYAKKDGGNKSIFFTKELPGIALEKLAMHIELHQAILKNQFFLNYQPQIDLKTGNICGAEALVRWKHPTKGMVSPDEFISYAEESGSIISVNEYIMRMVFQQVGSDWNGPPISVNISGKQFKDKYHLVEYLESLMREFSVNPKHIELEITESLVMEDTQHNIAILGAIHELGFKVAIDDFGTGFSSFNYLYRIPAHKIKIDRSFIAGLPTNQANVEIVKSMIALLHSLGRIVVAEGVETEAENEFLKMTQCDIVQGYYYYKPIAADELVDIISKSHKPV